MDHPVAQRRLATLNSQLNPSTDDADVLHLEPQETLAAWTYISSGFRTTWAVRIADWRNNWSFTNVFENSAWYFPDNPCIFFEDAKYTYTEVNEFSNQIAHWAHDDLSIKPGDVVALIMENRPEFLWTWIGLAKAGATIAFINYKLHGASLVHVLDTAQAKAYIVGSELVDTFMAVYKHKVGDCYVYFGNHGIGQKDQIPASMKVLDAHIQDLATRYENSSKKEGSATQSGLKMISKNPPKEWSTLITINSPLWLIYTSGTTGFPKAARVTHRNVLARTHILYGMSHATSADRIYCCLPLYHSSGSTISLLVWYAGGAIILRRQFSAKEFMEDCRRYGATLFVYIGELCRYIHATPESQDDKTHNIRMGIGNGLRPDIWAKFQNRFGIPLIMELYASTEGTSMVNLYNKVGAIGYLPWLIRKAAFTGKLIKYDVETDNHIRDKNGFCIECGPNEPGELITDMDASPRKTVTSGGTFTGYTDEKATEKKILRDVFQKGDRWFRTGDLIKMDDQGFFYFVDRIGDTFRWKGENVSTNEVAEVMSVFPGIAEVNVYGVQVPHNEGRCGMASIVLEKPGTEVDWKKLYAHLETNLPGYAHPQFIRLQQEIDKTSTFKFKKVEYAKEAFHLDGVKDPIFVRDEVNRTFVQLDNSLYNAIIHGKARL